MPRIVSRGLESTTGKHKISSVVGPPFLFYIFCIQADTFVVFLLLFFLFFLLQNNFSRFTRKYRKTSTVFLSLPFIFVSFSFLGSRFLLTKFQIRLNALLQTAACPVRCLLLPSQPLAGRRNNVNCHTL